MTRARVHFAVLVVAVLLGGLVYIMIPSASSSAAPAADLDVPFLVTIGAPGTTHPLASVDTPAGDIGRLCDVTVTVHNNDSVHDVLYTVHTGARQLDVPNAETNPPPGPATFHDVELGPTIAVTRTLGPVLDYPRDDPYATGASGGVTVTHQCPEAPTTTTPVTTPDPTTTTTTTPPTVITTPPAPPAPPVPPARFAG